MAHATTHDHDHAHGEAHDHLASLAHGIGAERGNLAAEYLDVHALEVAQARLQDQSACARHDGSWISRVPFGRGGRAGQRPVQYARAVEQDGGGVCAGARGSRQERRLVRRFPPPIWVTIITPGCTRWGYHFWNGSSCFVSRTARIISFRIISLLSASLASDSTLATRGLVSKNVRDYLIRNGSASGG